jgi:hypothetical protein
MVYVAMDDDEGILVWLGGWGFGNINLDGHPRTLCGQDVGNGEGLFFWVLQYASNHEQKTERDTRPGLGKRIMAWEIYCIIITTFIILIILDFLIACIHVIVIEVITISSSTRTNAQNRLFMFTKKGSSCLVPT